jgi:hypothetical protein
MITVLCVCVRGRGGASTFQLSNQITDLHEIWYANSIRISDYWPPPQVSYFIISCNP